MASFLDANPYATLTDFTTAPAAVSINWGDATPSTAGTVAWYSKSPFGVTFTVSGSHTYADEGAYNVTISIEDSAGVSTTTHATYKVADALLSAGAPVVLSATGGGSIGVPTPVTIANFVDAHSAGLCFYR